MLNQSVLPRSEAPSPQPILQGPKIAPCDRTSGIMSGTGGTAVVSGTAVFLDVEAERSERSGGNFNAVQALGRRCQS